MGIDWLAVGAFFKFIIAYMITTGTNAQYVAFVLKNILLLGTIAYITPWSWDNKLMAYIKKSIKSFNKKGEENDKEEPTK